MDVLRSFALLLLFQFAGELLRVALHVPVPGPVIGLALLAGWLARSKTALSPAMERTAGTLLTVLGLLFVPAGVGIFANLPLLKAAWFPLLVSLVVSTLLSLVITAGVMHWMVRRAARGSL